MKTIGLLGGMSWESTVTYYRIINNAVKDTMGGLHSARLVLYSVDFEEIEQLQQAGDWAATARILGKAATGLEHCGADFLVICTNTMHIVAPEIEKAVSVPLLHIADATAAAIQAADIRRVGLLGTRFTMEEPFYRGRMEKRFGIEVLVPEKTQRQAVHDVIYDELCLGAVREGSRRRYLDIIDDLAHRGAEAVILGCTEISLLVEQAHTAVPLFDTTRIHAEMAAAMAMGHAF